MRYLKHFEGMSEKIPLRQPIYKKGEILIWSESRDVDYDFAKKLLKRVGLELIGEPYDRGFLVKCPSGEEISTAKKVIERFPEFFDSYEREDIRVEYISDRVERIGDKVESIEDFFGSLTNKNVNVKKYNAFIDDIIKELTDIKI